MKTQYCYICEKCGASFEDADKAYACERSHMSDFNVITSGYSIDSFCEDYVERNEYVEKEHLLPQYRKGDTIPKIITIYFTNEETHEVSVVCFEPMCILKDPSEKFTKANILKHAKAGRNAERLSNFIETYRDHLDAPHKAIDNSPSWDAYTSKYTLDQWYRDNKESTLGVIYKEEVMDVWEQ